MAPDRKRPGPKPSGRPRKMNIGFSATPADHAWLTALPNRSAWLAAKVAADRDSGADSGAPTRTDPPTPHQDAE